VKPGREEEFVRLHKEMAGSDMPGARAMWVLKTGERSYIIVGEWNSFDDIVKARPAMIGSLDKMRDMLEDLGGGRGVTEPYSGEVVVELKNG
jgi:hypothetical protein